MRGIRRCDTMIRRYAGVLSSRITSNHHHAPPATYRRPDRSHLQHIQVLAVTLVGTDVCTRSALALEKCIHSSQTPSPQFQLDRYCYLLWQSLPFERRLRSAAYRSHSFLPMPNPFLTGAYGKQNILCCIPCILLLEFFKSMRAKVGDILPGSDEG